VITFTRTDLLKQAIAFTKTGDRIY